MNNNKSQQANQPASMPPEDQGEASGASSGHFFDPKTVFVGGLDAFGPDAWGVDRLRAVFEKYGVVEDVKLICPCEHFTKAH